VDEYRKVPTNIMMANSSPGLSENSDYKELMGMYDRKEYARLSTYLQAPANSGDARAQELLGIMYRYGQGVTKDPKKAITYLTAAANARGVHPLAQYHLGTMYFAGEGVHSDPVTALKWLQIAVVHYPEGPEKTAALRDREALFTRVTPEEKNKAMRMAREWLVQCGEAKPPGTAPSPLCTR
jgi:TPR repeat protein